MAKKKKKRVNPLLDPGTVLRGPQLRRAARAAANIEYRPQIRAHRSALRDIARNRRRDDRALAKLGRKTNQGINNVYRGLNSQMQQGIAHSQRIGAKLQQDTNLARQTRQEDLGRLETGLMGNQLDSLSQQNITPGASETQAAFAQAVRQQQGTGTATGQSFADMANAASAGGELTARNRLAASQMARASAITSNRSAVASRRMLSRQGYGDSARDVRDSLRTVRGLRGAQKLENIMRLRAGERSFVNERAALMLDSKENDQDYALGLAKIDAGGGGGGGRGGGGGGLDPQDRPKQLRPFWGEWLKAANQVRDGGTIGVGGWNKFLDSVEKEKKLDWTATQRNKFLKRYKKWYKNNVGK